MARPLRVVADESLGQKVAQRAEASSAVTKKIGKPRAADQKVRVPRRRRRAVLVASIEVVGGVAAGARPSRLGAGSAAQRPTRVLKRQANKKLHSKK